VETSSSNLDHRLRIAGPVFAFGSAIHIADHLRRGQASISDTLYALGNTAVVVQVVTITLIATRHRFASTVAAVAGPVLAIGFLAAHWLPHWSAVSDPVWEVMSYRWFSVVASISEIIGAAWVGGTGIAIALRDVQAVGATAPAMWANEGEAHNIKQVTKSPAEPDIS
jgi:hypothetical protein